MLQRFLTSLRREAWRKHKRCSFLFLFLLLALFSACSLKRMAVNSFANAFTEGSSRVYARDDDPELVGDALPFALKTIESLLETVPDHKGLLIAAASGFVQYAHAYVLRPAQTLAARDRNAARRGRLRAARLFLRGREYGLRALEVSHPGISKNLVKNRQSALSKTKPEDVPALYWTGAAWASAISVSKDDMALVGDLNIVQALMERALQLDESWGEGAIHEFFIHFTAGRSEAEGGGLSKAEEHFRRAMELNRGRSISPLVALAESVCVRQQDRQRFENLLQQALQFNVNQSPDKRLANLLAQQKAQQLLENIDELFFLDAESANDRVGLDW